MPGARDVIVADVPVPEVVLPPGDRVIIQVPEAGRPPSVTPPVDVLQVGLVIVPTTGAVGVEGWELITASAEETEVNARELVTVKL